MKRFVTPLVALAAVLFLGSLLIPQKADSRQGCTYSYRVSGISNRTVTVDGNPVNLNAYYAPDAVMTITGSGAGNVTLTRVVFPAYCSGGKITYIAGTGTGFMAIWIDE